MFGAKERMGPASDDEWVHTWWPLVALVLGVLLVVAGGILYSS